MTDDLIDQLRDANPEPHPDPLPIEPIWGRLAILDQGRSNHARRPVLVRKAVGALPVVLALALTILVVVIVGLSLRSHSPTSGSSGRSGSATCSPDVQSGDLPGVTAILSEVQLLRQPIAASEETAAYCAAQVNVTNDGGAVPTDPAYKEPPVDLRYVGPSILGGTVFMYALPGAPRTIADHGYPTDSGLVRSELQPSVCLITIGGSQAASGGAAAGEPSGCTSLAVLRTGPRGFGATQIPGTTTSLLAGVIRDGITAVRVYYAGQLITTVAVHHNVVQFIVDHNAPAAAHLQIEPVA